MREEGSQGITIHLVQFLLFKTRPTAVAELQHILFVGSFI